MSSIASGSGGRPSTDISRQIASGNFEIRPERRPWTVSFYVPLSKRTQLLVTMPFHQNLDKRIEKVNRNDVKIGDHLVFRYRNYHHSAIYAGSSEMIHYVGLVKNGPKAGVKRTFLEDYKGNYSLYRYIYKDHEKKFHGQAVVDRAISRIGENKYNLIYNNCESFSHYCVTGLSYSE